MKFRLATVMAMVTALVLMTVLPAHADTRTFNDKRGDHQTYAGPEKNKLDITSLKVAYDTKKLTLTTTFVNLRKFDHVLVQMQSRSGDSSYALRVNRVKKTYTITLHDYKANADVAVTTIKGKKKTGAMVLKQKPGKDGHLTLRIPSKLIGAPTAVKVQQSVSMMNSTGQYISGQDSVPSNVFGMTWSKPVKISTAKKKRAK